MKGWSGGGGGGGGGRSRVGRTRGNVDVVILPLIDSDDDNVDNNDYNII